MGLNVFSRLRNSCLNPGSITQVTYGSVDLSGLVNNVYEFFRITSERVLYTLTIHIPNIHNTYIFNSLDGIHY